MNSVTLTVRWICNFNCNCQMNSVSFMVTIKQSHIVCTLKRKRNETYHHKIIINITKTVKERIKTPYKISSNFKNETSLYRSIITLNINGFNSSIKRVAKWINNKYILRKQHPIVCCLQESHFSFKDTHRLKVKE